MKRRTKRDFGILVGVVVILAGAALFNSEIRRGNLIEEMDAWRTQVEEQRTKEGFEIMSWSLIRETKGKPRTGGTFATELKLYNGQPVNIIGFQVPFQEFVDVEEFMLLPLPIECYFCNLPPARDVMWVELKEGTTTSIYEEPVIIHGILNLNEGPDQKFFYTITEAQLGPGDTTGDLTKKKMGLEHMTGGSEHNPEELLAPVTTPATETPDTSDTD